MIETWRSIILGDDKSWVLFEHGTCVILMAPGEALEAQAIETMKAWGPVHAGSTSGDFSVIRLVNGSGWVITGHHPDVLNHVAPDEVVEGAKDFVIGLVGRAKRDRDAASLHVVHIEDKRKR
jgi:hypothetical protein